MKNLIVLIAISVVFFAFLPQEKIIQGKVTDTSGKPVSGVTVQVLPKNTSGLTDKTGHFKIRLSDSAEYLLFSAVGYENKKVRITDQKNIDMSLTPMIGNLNDVIVIGNGIYKQKTVAANYRKADVMIRGANYTPASFNGFTDAESYKHEDENGFKYAKYNPLSTFSIDVDNASYSNVRRFINNGNLPPEDAVRTEEMINYFKYDYPQPKGKEPVNIITQVSSAPWNTKHPLVQVALQAKTIPTDNLPASNLVFLIDVSGSMNEPNKLPLLISSLKMLTDNLRAKDKVAIVTYAGNAGVALPSTSAEHKEKIKDALNALSAYGSTNGAGGIEKAYEIASENFIRNGNNRIILATDGDFNVGQSSDEDMEKLIEKKRASGIFLTVLGFGMGNYKDSKMETLADKGNGNYAYIDNIQESRRVLMNEFSGTMFTVAKDVKLQIEFNPSKVQAYRLVGYENRNLNDEDFNDDKKDAGEIGSGQTVTAFYEIIPTGEKDTLLKNIDELKYQKAAASVNFGNELLTVKLRYKEPNDNTSKLLSKTLDNKIIPFEYTTGNFRFAAAVAEFGMMLKHSDYKQNSSYENIIDIAEKAKTNDEDGYKSEFIRLVKTAKDLKGNEASNVMPAQSSQRIIPLNPYLKKPHNIQEMKIIPLADK